MHHRAREFDLDLGIGEQMLHRLIAADGAAELGAILGIGDGHIDSPLGHAQHLRCGQQCATITRIAPALCHDGGVRWGPGDAVQAAEGVEALLTGQRDSIALDQMQVLAVGQQKSGRAVGIGNPRIGGVAQRHDLAGNDARGPAAIVGQAGQQRHGNACLFHQRLGQGDVAGRLGDGDEVRHGKAKPAGRLRCQNTQQPHVADGGPAGAACRWGCRYPPASRARLR